SCEFVGCRQKYLFTGLPLADAAPFIGTKEERSVLPDGAAERGAKLILVELRLDGIEIALGIENLVAEILVNIAVKRVGTGLGYDIDDGARVPSIFGIEGIGNDAEFRNRIGRRLHRRRVHKLIVGIATVDAEIVGPSAAAIHRHGTRRIAAVKCAAAGPELRLHARLQLQELIRVARIE